MSLKERKNNKKNEKKNILGSVVSLFRRPTPSENFVGTEKDRLLLGCLAGEVALGTLVGRERDECGV